MKKLIFALMLGLSITVNAQVTKDAATETVADDIVTTTNKVTVRPEYPGGIQEFYKFISGKFKRPKIGYEFTAQILVSFIVEKDGSMSSYKIVRDPGYGLGDETVRVLKLCYKKWKPGTTDGAPIRAAFNLPLTININN